MNFPTVTVKATARDAGRNVVHTVSRSDNGEVIAPVRRSAHRYNYAICRWVPGSILSEQKTLMVLRWSRNSKCKSREFAVYAEWI